MAITQRTYNTDRMNIYRLGARAFVTGGAIFWTMVVLAGVLGANSEGWFRVAAGEPLPSKFTTALTYAFVWIAIAAVIFIVGLFYENVAAILLAAAAVGAVVYGASMQWEPVLWFIVILFIILPIAISAILYVLAAR